VTEQIASRLELQQKKPVPACLTPREKLFAKGVTMFGWAEFH
jgi:hypothetical protein